MLGTVLNVAGILAGGLAGLMARKPLSPAAESYFKVTLGACTVYYGLRLTWVSVNGSLAQILAQLLLATVALMLGKFVGHLLGLQRFSNRLGQAARVRIMEGKPDGPHRLSDGFEVCAMLFCAAPLGLLGAVQDGLSGYVYPLCIKAAIDGLAVLGFVPRFGWGVMLAALPVLAFQGTITLAMRLLEPFLAGHELLDSVNAAGGLLVFSVALVILGLKRVELADYLPSLAMAPLLKWGMSVVASH